MTPKTYNVVRTGSFNKDFDRLDAKVERLAEFVRGVEEIVCRKPEIGKPTKDRFVLGLRMIVIDGHTGVTLYYCYTRTDVVFLFLRADGDKEPPPIIL